MRRIACFAAALLSLTAVFGLCHGEEKHTADIFAMDTHIVITAYGEGADEAIEAAKELLAAREALFSVTGADSEIAAINGAQGAAVLVSEDTAALLSYALEMAESTEGAFDPTIYPLVRAWGFTTDDYRVPEGAEIEEKIALVDYRRLSLAGNLVQMDAGMKVDLGGIAKGYVGDELIEMLRARGVSSALVSLGGNIHALGQKTDGSAWRIGVKSPLDDGLLGSLRVEDACVITSGAYERYFIGEDGKRYGHIIDSETGHPVENGVLSVTAVGREGKRCDALSTALFVMGVDAAFEYWRAHEGFDMLILHEDGNLYITEGIAEAFTPGDSALVEAVRIVER